MDMATAKKTFAQRYSTEFEKIVLAMVEEALQKDFEIIASENTKEQSDGGYDGYLFLKSSFDETSTALLEAKLRTAVKDLPLSDFSKSVIIAVNLDAACIIIGTNLYFSGNTVEQLETFIYNTGLEIRTLDYKDILEWLNRRPSISTGYKKNFLKELRKYAEKDYSTAIRELSLFERPPVINKEFKSIKIYGRERKTIKNNIISALQGSPAVFVIYGESGIGKKTLVECLLNELLPNINAKNTVRYVVHKIDMSSVMSQNDFIYRIISMLWGCNYDDTVDFFYGLSNPDLSNALTNFLPPKILTALSRLSHLYKNGVDIDVFFTYIADLYKKTIRRNRIRRVFYFYNLEYSQDMITDKLVITFIRKMSDVLSIILCLSNDKLLKKQKQGWAEFCDAVYESNNVKSFELSEWDNDSTICFVMDHCNDNEIAGNAETIINYFGKNPLCLATGTDLINKDKILLSYIKSGNFILDKSIYINKLQSAIAYNLKDFSFIQRQILYINLIMEELVKNEFLSSVLGMDIKAVMKETEGISYLTVKHSVCQWKNRLYLNLFKELEYTILGFSEKYDLFTKIIQNIDILGADFRRKNEVLLKIYVEMGDRDKALALSKILLNEYKHNTQYNGIYKMSDLLINSGILGENIYYNIFFRIELLKSAFDIGLNGGDTDFSEKYQVLREYIKKFEAGGGEISNEISFLLGKFYYISSIINLADSEYQKMQSNIERGFNFLQKIHSMESLQLQSELCANYATSLKHLINIESCVDYLRENEIIQSVPEIADMPRYQISFHTHFASLFTGSEPQRALEEFCKIDEICMNYSKEAYLHNLHNIASMKFIVGDYDGALKDAKTVYKESYEHNISIEFGRCQNLLGCLKWYYGDSGKAKNFFKSSYEHFRNHQHNTHVWAPLVNLAVFCKDGDDPDAYKYTKEASEILLTKHISQIKTAIIRKDNIPKIIVAILMVMYNLDSLRPNSPDILSMRKAVECENSEIIKMYDARIKGKSLKELFSNTAYNCSGKIMLKV